MKINPGNRPKLVGLLCTVIVGLMYAPAAHAGGFEYGVQGVETVARGGANVAKVSGPEALYLNVAGIAGGDGIEFTIDSNFIHTRLWAHLKGNDVNSWEKRGETWTIDYVPVENMTDIYADGFKMFPAPLAGVTFRIAQWKRLSLGFAIFGPAALGDFQFPETVNVDHEGSQYDLPSPQRYDIIYEKVLFMWPTVAAAFRLSERLSLGFGFQWGFINLKFTQAMNINKVESPTSHENDIISTFDAWDYFIPAGILGLRWNPIERLEMGFSLRFSDKIKAKGKVVTVALPYEDNPIYSDDPTLEWMDQDPYERPSGTLTFNWPTSVYRFGVRYIHPNRKAPIRYGRSLYPWEKELFDIELDFFVEANHVLDDMKMKIDGQIPFGRGEGQASPFKPTEDGTITLRRNWRDSVSIRLGGSVNLLRGHLTINWGGFYETPTTDDEDMRLDYMTNRKWGLSLGLQGRYYSIPMRKKRMCIAMSLSYLHIFYPKVEVENGKITHVSSNYTHGTVVNNGEYDFSMDILTAGIRITLL